MLNTPTSPRKAVVLAAGLGQRLRPFTLFQPKPLMPLGGEPLIERSLRQLETWGVTEIAVNLHWLAAPLCDYLTARRGKAAFRFSREPVILGTAGALLSLRDFIGAEPFWLVNADIVWRMPPTLLLRPWRCLNPLAAVWLIPDKGPRTVETDAAGTITTYRSRRAGQAGTATFSGVQIVSPRIFDHLPRQTAGVTSLVEVYEAAARVGETVIGVPSGGRSIWDDAGSIPDYLRLRRQCRVSRRSDLAPRLEEGFAVRRGGGVAFPAFLWPDPALAPMLAGAAWPLARTEVEPLSARGSDRSFLRLRHGSRSAIFVRYGHLRDENRRYAAHARLLDEAGVSVPRVLAEDAEARALLLEDVGGRSLRDACRLHPASTEQLYRLALDQVARLHTAATCLAKARRLEMEAAFDHRLYAWERDLFFNHTLRDRHGIDARPAELLADYTRVAAALLADGAPVIVHRDLQSTNIMVRRGRLALIDFQGMRFGSAAYDLASLLCDPYVNLAPDLRGRLLACYADRVGAAAGESVVRLFAFGAVQRLTQALGAFARLTALGLPEWREHIVPAATLLGEMAAACGQVHIHRLARETVRREERAQGGV